MGFSVSVGFLCKRRFFTNQQSSSWLKLTVGYFHTSCEVVAGWQFTESTSQHGLGVVVPKGNFLKGASPANDFMLLGTISMCKLCTNYGTGLMGQSGQSFQDLMNLPSLISVCSWSQRAQGVHKRPLESWFLKSPLCSNPLTICVISTVFKRFDLKAYTVFQAGLAKQFFGDGNRSTRSFVRLKYSMGLA